MSSSDSQTQAPSLNISATKSQTQFNHTQKTKKKTNKNRKRKEQIIKQEDIKTVKKQKNIQGQRLYAKLIQEQQKLKYQKMRQFYNKRNCCEHASVYKKLLYSIILTSICITIFAQPPKIDYPLAHIQQGKHQQVFEIVTDRKTRFISFNLQIEKAIGYLPITSTKTAKIKASVNYTLGYKFEQSQNKHKQRFNQHTQVTMSDLQILSYTISDIRLENRQDGFWNSWQFGDHQNLINYINDKYIKQMKKQTLLQISDQKKIMYETKAKFMLTQILQKYQSWFDWLLKRIDRYIDVGLQPYIKNYQIVASEK